MTGEAMPERFESLLSDDALARLVALVELGVVHQYTGPEDDVEAGRRAMIGDVEHALTVLLDLRAAHATLEQERDEARETNARLNRRLQAAESAVAEKVMTAEEAAKRAVLERKQGKPLGRMLANYAAMTAKEERDAALAAVAALREALYQAVASGRLGPSDVEKKAVDALASTAAAAEAHDAAIVDRERERVVEALRDYLRCVPCPPYCSQVGAGHVPYCPSRIADEPGFALRALKGDGAGGA